MAATNVPSNRIMAKRESEKCKREQLSLENAIELLGW